jgi:hypothetical protein
MIPGEALAIALLSFGSEAMKFGQLVLEKQPPDVAAELWRLHLEDVKAWREFWAPLIKAMGKANG